MSTERPALRPVGLLSMAGNVTTLVRAPASGLLCAGDDRGEMGLWAPDGTRLWEARGKAAVLRADVLPDGTAAAFACADGEVFLATERGRSVVRLRGRAGCRPLLDPGSEEILLLEPKSGEAELLGRTGRAVRGFRVPPDVADAAFVPRTGGLVVATRDGIVARITTWGKLVWGGDLVRPTAALAVDAEGREVWLALLSRGAECLTTGSGARVATFDAGRPVECVAVTADRVAFGCSDGALAVTDRRGLLLAEGHAGRRVRSVAARDGGHEIFAATADGVVRIHDVEERASATPAARPEPSPDVRRFSCAPGPVSLTRVSPLGAWLVTQEGPRAVRVDGIRGESVIPHQGTLLDARISDEGSLLLATTTGVRGVAGGAVADLVLFDVEPGAAVFSADESAVAVADVLGRGRLVSLADGMPLAAVPGGSRRTVSRLAATRAAVALEERGHGVLLFGDGWSRPVEAAEDDGVLRLADLSPDGPVVLSDRLVACHGWDGRRRWRALLPAPPRAAAALSGGRVLAVLATEAGIFDRSGRRISRFAVPPGSVADASGAAGEDGGARIALVEGRRVTVVNGTGAVLARETFDAPVLSAVLARGAPVAVCRLEGAVVRLDLGAHATSLPGGAGP